VPPPASAESAQRWFATARGALLVGKLAALGVFAFLLLKITLGGGL
jgi:hypothetical protein